MANQNKLALVKKDEVEYIQKAADDEYGPLCQKCYGEEESENGE